MPYFDCRKQEFVIDFSGENFKKSEKSFQCKWIDKEEVVVELVKRNTGFEVNAKWPFSVISAVGLIISAFDV
jgi:hypothetical protein